VKKSIKLVSASLAAAIAAPYKNKNTRADACQQVAVCIESLDRLLGDASIKAIIDVDAITGAIAKQMSKPPALPQKASKAFARICNLLGCAVPDVEMREANDEDDDDYDGGDSDSDVAPEKPKKKSKDEKKRKKSAGDASAKKKKTKK
jgi:DNA polymerase phi